MLSARPDLSWGAGMKLTEWIALCGAVTCSAVLGLPVKAKTYPGSDTKHGSLSFSARHSYEDFDKFEWLSPQDGQTLGAIDHIVVSLTDQRLYAYHEKQLLAWSNISSGRPGRETPTGSYTVSEKDIDHHSSLYDNASMPYFMRLTDDGLGLHAGFLPGYPASHGCVRMPLGMAKELYDRVDPGTRVQITSDSVDGLKGISAQPIAALSQL